MSKKEEKTNVMRLLEQKKIAYTPHSYEGGALSGAEVAAAVGKPPECVFKTLVTVGASGGHYVFVVPVLSELNLKAAARLSGEKSIRMIPQKELLPLTGYVHGGCSPIGMKKPFPTFVDESALACPTILFSAGKVGYQVELAPEELRKMVNFQTGRLCEGEGSGNG